MHGTMVTVSIYS